MSHTHDVLIESLAQGAEGVGRLADGRVVFVAQTLPGERVTVTLTQSRKKWARGRLDALITPSPARETPGCVYAARCGGCQLWHTSWQTERALKVEAAAQTVQRFAGPAPLPAVEVLYGSAPTSYRHRATLQVSRGRVGFHARGSHEVIAITGCAVLAPVLARALPALSRALAPLDEAQVRVETASAESIVVGWREARASAQVQREVAQALLALAAVRGVHVTPPQGEPWALGRPEIDASLALAVTPLPEATLPAGLFRQANLEVNRLMVAALCEHLAQLGAEQVLELYAGSGNVTFAMTARGMQVVALEGEGPAVEAGRALAVASGAPARFEAVDLSGAGLARWLEREPGPWPVVVLDPPRTGAREVCEVLADRREVRELVYISCDPACLGRDVATLRAGGFEVTRWWIADMFPRTAHVESLMMLRRR